MELKSGQKCDFEIGSLIKPESPYFIFTILMAVITCITLLVAVLVICIFVIGVRRKKAISECHHVKTKYFPNLEESSGQDGYNRYENYIEQHAKSPEELYSEITRKVELDYECMENIDFSTQD